MPHTTNKKMTDIKKNSKKTTILFVSAAVLLTVLFFVSLCIGKYPLSAGTVLNIISGKAAETDAKVFVFLRLARCLMALIVGIALGVSGAVYQTVFRNPLASPDLIGVSAGANLGAATVIVLLSGAGFYSVIVGSFLGGMLAALAVMLIARAIGNNSTAIYILAGIMINAVSTACLMALKYFADTENELAAIEYWEMGSLGNITMDKLLYVLPIFAISLCGILLLSRQIGLMSLGDNEARALGVRLKAVRTMILMFNTLLVASAISTTGLISFVGLTAPHIAKAITKRNGKAHLILSGLVGALVVLAADTAVRAFLQTELPVSILTTAIGVPVLAVFLIKRRNRA